MHLIQRIYSMNEKPPALLEIDCKLRQIIPPPQVINQGLIVIDGSESLYSDIHL